MEKENLLKKVLKKAMAGFPIGVTVLMIEYASIYFIEGEGLFNAELNQLHNINTLISQILSVGIAGFIIFLCANAIWILQNKELESKIMNTKPYTSIITISIVAICLMTIVMFILGNEQIFSENIRTLNIIALVIWIVIQGVFLCIKSVKESNLVKKINEKIEERNK